MGSKQQHTHAPDRTTLLKCGIGWIWLDITMTCVTQPGVSEWVQFTCVVVERVWPSQDVQRDTDEKLWYLPTMGSHESGVRSMRFWKVWIIDQVSAPQSRMGQMYMLWLTYTHTHLFNGPLSGTTRVSWYQKGKTNLDFTEARDWT